MSLGWQQLHSLVGLHTDEERGDSFSGIGALDDAGPDDISFLGNPRYEPQLAETRAGLVLVPEGDYSVPKGCQLVVVDNPSVAFSKVIAFFEKQANPFEPGVGPGAHLAENVDVDPSLVQIGPNAVIESGASIGRGSIIGAGCLIGKGVSIGEDCLLYPGVIIRERCVVGDRVILQPGCVIGSDGYGFELVDGRHQKVPQVGIVEIENDVEIGANSCVDRARFGKTVIGEGTKVDNLVQIGHNVKIGKHCLLVAHCGIAGSVKFGDYVTMAAQAGIAGHLEVASNSVIGAQSGVLKSLTKPGVYLGLPARPMAAMQRTRAAAARVPKLLKDVRQLKKKLEELSGE